MGIHFTGHRLVVIAEETFENLSNSILLSLHNFLHGFLSPTHSPTLYVQRSHDNATTENLDEKMM